MKGFNSDKQNLTLDSRYFSFNLLMKYLITLMQEIDYRAKFFPKNFDQ